MTGLRQQVERLWPALAALAAAVAMAAVLLLLRGGLSRPPVVVQVEVDPDPVSPDRPARVRVVAEDPDGDRLTFAFRADKGRVEADPARAREAWYSAAPDGPIADRLTVTVTDTRGLVTTSSRGITIESVTLPATPTPLPEATPTPAPAAPTAAAAPAQTLPSTRTPTAPPTAVPTRTPVNQPPVLTGGTTLDGVESAVAGLAAEGHDPDGDPITYKWDWGDCAIAEAWERNMADVRLKDGCLSATVILTWTDSKGASTSTEWYINR